MRHHAIIALLALCSTGSAQLPSDTMTLTGFLRDAGGTPIPGPASLTFRIYEDMAGGVAIWQELHAVVSIAPDGRYAVRLGAFNPLSPAEFATQDRWLSIEANADGEMTPRLALQTMPYSHDAQLLDGSPPSVFAPRAELIDGTPATTPVGWNDILGVPPTILDGDDDTTYSASAGVRLMGTDFSADFAGAGVAATVARSDHDHAGVYVDATDLSMSDGSPPNSGANLVHWDILNGVPLDLLDGDDDTTYTASAGVRLVSADFSADFAGAGVADTVARSDHDHAGLQMQIDDLQTQINILQMLVGGGGGGGGGFSYPDGIAGMPVTATNLQTTPYIVPAGKNLYAGNLYSLGTGYWLDIDGAIVVRGFSGYGDSGYAEHLENTLVAGAGQTVGSNNDSVSFNGLLTDAGVTPVTLSGLSTAPYVVPAGQSLVVTNVYSLSTSYRVQIDGTIVVRGFSGYGDSLYEQRLGKALLAAAGQTVDSNNDNVVLNGYLR